MRMTSSYWFMTKKLQPREELCLGANAQNVEDPGAEFRGLTPEQLEAKRLELEAELKKLAPGLLEVIRSENNNKGQ